MRQAEKEKLGRNDPCWCDSGKKYKKCHLAVDRQAAVVELPGLPGLPAPSRVQSLWRKAKSKTSERILIKSQEQIEGIRRACQLTRDLLDQIGERIREGVTTEALDQWIHDTTRAHGGYPATLGYQGYSKSSCISINEVVCHGIPGPRPLRSGDIVNIDAASVLGGYFGDASRMYLVGEVSDEARRLVEVTRECLERGIAAVRPGGHVGDIGHAIKQHAEPHGFSVVRQFVGHGVGVKFHEPPQVSHYARRGTGAQLVPGMVFTIELMINAGRHDVEILDDGWTAVTLDRSLSAQWEHTVAVTDTGVDVLTG